MSDMREDMLKRLGKQHASKLERSKALWKMSADERVAAMRRGELTWGQLCEWAIKARHEVPLINGEYEFIPAYTPEVQTYPSASRRRRTGRHAQSRAALHIPTTTRPRQALACQAMEYRLQIPIKIAIDGQPVRSDTLATSVGAYILAIETVLPDQAIDLHSVYTGHANAKTQATHLILSPELREATTVEHDHDQLPVMHSRRTCLYDHLHQLQDLFQSHDTDVQLTIEDSAIGVIER